MQLQRKKNFVNLIRREVLIKWIISKVTSDI